MICKHCHALIDDSGRCQCPSRAADTVPAMVGNTFALLSLSDLKLRRFATKDELMDAIHALRSREIGFAAFIYNSGAGVWTQPETWQ